MALHQGFPNFSARDPQNNGARDWGPPSSLEVAYNVGHSRANTLLGLHEHQYNTKEQQPNSHKSYKSNLGKYITKIYTIDG